MHRPFLIVISTALLAWVMWAQNPGAGGNVTAPAQRAQSLSLAEEFAHFGQEDPQFADLLDGLRDPFRFGEALAPEPTEVSYLIVGEDGVEQGPFTLPRLREMAAQETLTRNTLLRREPGAEPIRAGNLESLAGAFPVVVRDLTDEEILASVSPALARRVEGFVGSGGENFLRFAQFGLKGIGDSISFRLPQTGDRTLTFEITGIDIDAYTVTFRLNAATSTVRWREPAGGSGNITPATP